MIHTAGQSRALVDGVVAHTTPLIPILDLRGDGALETIGVWGGRPFRMDDHLQRLAQSLEALMLPSVPSAVVAGEVAQLLDGATGDAALRIHCLAGGPRILTLDPIPSAPVPTVLSPQPAPWIQPLQHGRLPGPKSLSYARYMAARRAAIAAGADDALLVAAPDPWVLEGPTSGVALVIDGALCIPEEALGVVRSISLIALADLAAGTGMNVEHGRWLLSDIARATEVIVSSSLRMPAAVARVGDWVLGSSHPVTARLGGLLQAARSAG